MKVGGQQKNNRSAKRSGELSAISIYLRFACEEQRERERAGTGWYTIVIYRNIGREERENGETG